METGVWVLDETILLYTYSSAPTELMLRSVSRPPRMRPAPMTPTMRSALTPPRMRSRFTFRYEVPPRFRFQRIANARRYEIPPRLRSHHISNTTTQPVAMDEQQNLPHPQSLNGRVGCGLSQECVSDYLMRSLGHLTTTENIICSICQGEIQVEEEISTLRCSHIYHAGCIGQWLMVKNECPVCRASVISEEDIGRAVN